MADHGIDLSKMADMLLSDIKQAISEAGSKGETLGEAFGEGFAKGVSSKKTDIVDEVLDVKKAKKRIKELQASMTNAANQIKNITGKKQGLGKTDYDNISRYNDVLKRNQREIDGIIDRLKQQGVVVRNTTKQYKELQGVLEDIGYVEKKKKTSTPTKRATSEMKKQTKVAKEQAEASGDAVKSAEQLASAAKEQAKSMDAATAAIERQTSAVKKYAKAAKSSSQAVSAISKFQTLLGDLGKKYGDVTFNNVFGGIVSSFNAINESNVSQVYDALIAKDKEYQAQLEEESKVREKIAEEVKAYADATKYIYKNGEPSQDILKAYTSYWEKVSAGAMSAADAVKAFEQEWNQLGGAVDYQQKKQIDEIRSLIRNQKEWLKYLEQSLNPDNFKTSGKKEATQQLRDLTYQLRAQRKNNYQNDDSQYNRQMIEVAWAQGYKEAQRQGVAESTLVRYRTDALGSYDDNLRVLQEVYDFRKKLLGQYEEELNKIERVTSATEKQAAAMEQTVNGLGALSELTNNTAIIETETKAIEANTQAVEENIEAKQKMERQGLRSGITELPQEFTSEKTSINSNKLPAIFGKSNSKYVLLGAGTTNLDYGGGRFDNVTEYLSGRGVRNLVYDPYNRTKEHNDDVIRTIQEQGLADTATLSNVLNVIKEQEVRNNVLQNLSKLTKPGGQVYITVYEGTGKGDEGPTSSGYQLNRRTEDYLDEIRQVFPDAVRHGKLIVATNNIQALPQVQREQQKLFATPSGQIGMFEGMTDPIFEAVDATEELKDAMQEVVQIPGQINFDEAVKEVQKIAEVTREATKEKRKYYEIDEKAAKLSKQMGSFDDYKEGSATASYKAAVDEMAKIVEGKKAQLPDKSEQLDKWLDQYAKNLATYINRDNQIGAQYPSVMISGAGNYNIKKHNRQMASWGKNYQYYDDRVLAIANKIKNLGSTGTDVIRGDESDALEKLEARLEYMKYWHDVMVEVNKYYRKNKTLDGFEGVEPDELERIKKDLAMIKQVGMYDVPYPKYALSNDSQNIKRIEGRVAELKRLKGNEGLQEENDIYKLWTDKQDMRIRISFEIGEPEQEIIDLLKGNGFKRSHKNQAWQRQLTDNAVYATERIQKALREHYQITSNTQPVIPQEKIPAPVQPTVAPNAVKTAIQESTGSQPVEIPVKPVVEQTEDVVKSRISNLVAQANQIPPAENTTRFVHFTDANNNQSIFENGLRLVDQRLNTTALSLQEYQDALNGVGETYASVMGVAQQYGSSDNAVLLDIPNDSIIAYTATTGGLETVSRSFVRATIDTKNGLYELNTVYDVSHDVVSEYTEAIREAKAEEEGMTSRRPGLKRSASLEAVQAQILESRKSLATGQTGNIEVTQTADATTSATNQLAQGIQQVGDAAQQASQQLEQQASANETLAESSERAGQTLESGTPADGIAPPALPGLTASELKAVFGDGSFDRLLANYEIKGEGRDEIYNLAKEMAMKVKALLNDVANDKGTEEDAKRTAESAQRLNESVSILSDAIVRLGTQSEKTDVVNRDELKEFYNYMAGQKIRYNKAQRVEIGDGWRNTTARFGRYLSSTNGLGADTIYQEAAELFPGLFNINIINDIEQFFKLLEVLGRAMDAKKNNWKTETLYPISEEEVGVEVLGLQEHMFERLSASSSEVLKTEQEIGATVESTNQKRQEGANIVAQSVQQTESQSETEQDVVPVQPSIEPGAVESEVQENIGGNSVEVPIVPIIEEDGEKERQSIIERDEVRALEVLRKAKDNKTNLVDLSNVYSTNDLKGQLESMATKITDGEKIPLSVGDVRIQDNIAAVTMYNEALGITYKQLYKVSEAADDASKSQLELWSESYDENYKAAQKYSEAQKKKIAQDDRWLIGQASKLNTQERKYKYSGKTIDGKTVLSDADETSLAADTDKTIDSLTEHIKSKIQASMGQGLTDEVRNQITNDLRILDNEIKIQQYKQYVSTTMKPSELKSAKADLEYTLQSLEAKAKKNNVFSQIEQDVIDLRSQLQKVTDGTGLSEFIDNLRTTKSKLNAEIAKEQTVKKEEQNYQNLINLQNRLYEAKKKLNDLEIKGKLDTAEGQQASRKVEDLQKQYDLSFALLKNEENRKAIEERGYNLESEMNTAKDQKQIEQYYQNIFETVQRINNLDSQINTLKMKDGGKGIYSDLIASLESEKSTLLGKIDQIGADINQYFNGVFASVGDTDKIQLPFNSLLKDTNSYNIILDFLNSVGVRAAIGADSVNKLVQAFYNSSQTGSEFVAKITEQFNSAETAFGKLQQIVASGGLNAENKTYQDIKKDFDMLKELNKTDKSKWTSEGIAYFTELAKKVMEYSNSLSKAAEQEAQYFAGKTKAYSGDTMYGNPQKNEIIKVDAQDSKIDSARQKLEEYVATFTEGKGIITDFTTAANGISQISFSALDKGTGQFRTFTAEIGQFTDNIYRTETTLNGLTSGTNAAKKSVAALGTLMQQLNGIDGAEGKIKEVYNAYQNLQNLINNKGNSQDAGDQNLLKNAAVDADNLRKQIVKLVNEWLKIQTGLDAGSATNLGSIDKNGDIQSQMENLISTTYGATAAVTGFDKTTNTLTYTLTNADGTVTTMTAHMYGLNGAVVTQQGQTKKLVTGWQEFGSAVGGVVKQLIQYLGRTFSVWGIVSQLKQGFSAVKEIDAALTELKKVTDETEGSYQKFLATASQTAGKIGSTVSDFTTATSNFARLGYTMEESAKMAETAIVYKNVADGLDTVEESTESIISTMKAFGIESNDTMGIIDRFNEVKVSCLLIW